MSGVAPLDPVPLSRFKAARFEKRVQIALSVLDPCALLGAYFLSLPLSSALTGFFGLPANESLSATIYHHHVIFFVLAMAVLLYFSAKGHYTKRLPWWSQIQSVTKIFTFCLLVHVFAVVMLGLPHGHILVLTSWGLGFFFLVGARLWGNFLKSRLKSWIRPTVVIADLNTAIDTLFALSSEKGMGLEPRAILLRNKDSSAFDRNDFPKKYREIEVLPHFDSFDSFVLDHSDHFYIVSLETLRGEKRDHLITLLMEQKIDFAVIPAVMRMTLYHTEPWYFFGHDIILLRTRLTIAALTARILKRSMDICGALIGLLLLGLPMLLVAVMLKVEGQGGTVLYGGARVGKKGKIFRCWKFRSMEPGTDHLLHAYLAENPEARAHWDKYLKLPDDPRVQTRTSRFIRCASIDELPQLWNVLIGEMSIVGPRPILESEIEAYGAGYKDYISVKPGLTGLWQASGRSETSFQRRVQWDSWYIRNWSLWGDVVIILKTVSVVLNRSGSS